MVGYNNGRNSFPGDFRDREMRGPPRHERDDSQNVWQHNSFDGGPPQNFGRRDGGFRGNRDGGFPHDGPIMDYNHEMQPHFDYHGQRNEYDGREDFHQGQYYPEENQGYEGDFRFQQQEEPPPPQRPPRRPMRPGEKPDSVKDLLYEMQGNTYNIKTAITEPKKFTSRCRLFIAPLPPSVTEETLKQWFGQYGEVGEIFLNKVKNFAFVKLDSRENCEAAKNSLDLAKKDGVTIRVRFSSNPSAVKVSNLSNCVTNELLEKAFSVFGEVERAIVIADERGRPIGEGVVEFAQKRSAVLAIRRCEEECFLLTSSPRPVIVEPCDFRDENEGLPERNLNKTKAYQAERELGPRQALPGSFEYEFSLKWKKLFESSTEKKKELEYDVGRCRQMLEEQLEYYVCEHEANVLREKLRAMEEQTQQIQRDREMRIRQEEVDRRRCDDDDMRHRMPMDGMDNRHSFGGMPPRPQGHFTAPMNWQSGGPQVPPPYQNSRSGQPPPRY